MNKVKPYLFWIICGSVLLIELILLMVVSPSSDGKSPEQVKTDIDAKRKDLDQLWDQARAGSPAGRTFDAQNPQDITALTKTWLATPSWKGPLMDLLNRYQGQMDGIKDYLVKRSLPLHEPISNDADKFSWYNEYVKVTAELLQQLHEQHCLVLPAAHLSTAPVNPGAGSSTGGPTPPSAVGPVPDADADAPDFKTTASNRDVARFLTTREYPDAERHSELTTQFRVMQQVARALLDTKATNAVSPAAAQKTPFEGRAQLASTTWKDTTDDAITVSLTLQGPLSAVLAAESSLEENKDDATPVKAVLGATLERKLFLAGERREITSEPVVLKLTLAVLDFSSLAKQDLSVLPKAAAPSAAPTKRVVKTTASSEGSSENSPTARTMNAGDQ